MPAGFATTVVPGQLARSAVANPLLKIAAGIRIEIGRARTRVTGMSGHKTCSVFDRSNTVK